MYFLRRSTQFSKTCCRQLITSKFLALGLPFHGWKSPEIAWDKIWIAFYVRLGKSDYVEPHKNIRRTYQISSHAISGLFHHEKGVPRQEISKWSTVWSTFSRIGWSVVRNASLAKGDTSEKGPSSHLHKVPFRSNKVNPRTLQTPSYLILCWSIWTTDQWACWFSFQMNKEIHWVAKYE
jgi:hypothetical protein